MAQIKWASKPFIRFTLCYIAGVLLFHIYTISTNIVLFTLGVNVLAYCLFFSLMGKENKRKFAWVFSISGFLLLILIAYANTAWHQESKQQLLTSWQDGDIEAYTAKVVEPPKEKANGYNLTLEVQQIKQANTWGNIKGKVNAYLPFKDSIPRLNDILLIKGSPMPYQDPLNPGEFDYGKFMNRQGIYLQHYLKQDNIQLYSKARDNLFTYSYRLRAYYTETFKKYITGKNELAIALALVLGVKDQLDYEIKDAYSGAGAMHVLAVSGLHVGIIFNLLGFLLFVLKKHKYGRWVYGLITVAFLWVYAAITGFSPSVVRASTMFTFVLVATVINRKSSIYNTLAASALCMLVYDPNFLFQVGFQLSYIAVFGIVYIHPKLYEIIKVKNYLLDKLWSISVVSIAAQIATFPLSLYYFHQFPVYFLLANPIVITVAMIVVSVGILLPLIGLLPYISMLLGKMLGFLLYLMNLSVSIVNQLPFSRTEAVYFDTEILILIYFSVIGLVAFLAIKRLNYFKVATLCVFLISATSIYKTQNTKSNTSLTVYAVKQHTCISIVYNQEAYVIVDKELKNNSKKLAYHIGNHLLQQGYSDYSILSTDSLYSLPFPHKTEGNNIFMVPDGKKIAIVKNNSTLPNIQLDLAICVSNGFKNTKYLKKLHAKQLIFDSSNSPYYSSKIQAELTDTALEKNCYFTPTKGAFTYIIQSGSD
jgi:competence protein ComEC